MKYIKHNNKLYIIGIFVLFILFIIYFNTNIELFDNSNISIISKLKDDSGFYSQLFFMINHYIYCKENKINFKIDSSDWMYKYNYGWIDYFEQIELKFNDSVNDKIYKHSNILDNYSINTYKNSINEIYIYNNITKNHINNIKKKLNLNNSYDSIYIRRGDKLISEAKISQESIYINMLLKINPNCKTIFLQTDDYTCFTNLQKHINNNNLNIQLLTICNENNVGAITNNYYKDSFKNTINENKDYISTIYDKLKKTITIKDMNKDEKYEHTLELLTSIDICINSNICICDFQSNVSRFIKLAHKNINNVYDINNFKLNLSSKKCPSYSF